MSLDSVNGLFPVSPLAAVITRPDLGSGPFFAETVMSSSSFAVTAPVHVAKVGLRARDGKALAAFYEDVVGLRVISRQGNTIGLGAGGRELLSIEDDPSLRPDDPRSAGLYHTAFLLPDRKWLARWVGHAVEKRVPIAGASDHLVSEAIYLDDPEGNGIEIYADRAPDSWPRDEGTIRMATERLDLEGLLATLPPGDPGWSGAPDGTVIGHVHLRAGDIDQAESWWGRELGLDTMVHYGNQAVFLASGGYHHHIGANIWRSRGAGLREADRAGLAYVEMISALATKDAELADPWGTRIRIRSSKAA
jgi:catechol 2,3-dioxygenase